MTLIVGILCSDGVVIASDGAATLGSPGSPTVRQEVKKLDIISDKIVVGVSGPVGLGQKMKETIANQYNSKVFSSKTPLEVSSLISDGMRTHIVPLFQTAKVTAPVVGNGMAGTNVMSSSVVAMIIQRKPALFQFAYDAASEQATEDIPFIAVGSGQGLADPFLAFLRRIFWKDHLPTLNEGIFAALWAVEQAIIVNPGGVSKPIQVAVLTEEDGGVARELDATELEEHYQSIQAAENKLSTYKTEIIEETIAQDIPTPVEEE